ncbi:OmpA family protein [Flavobacterium sp.]|uniref:OmpA family protein n=1 Tax=Flavobacterium sp. TaxID=239 RepID=UPI003D6BE821
MNKSVFFVLFFITSVLSYSQEQFSVFFESNEYNLSPSESKSLQKWILQNKESKILSIHGFTDEDGSIQYNDSLSSKRVETIFNWVKNRVKIREDFKKVSFGENFRLSKIKAQNRRVIIHYLLSKDLHLEAEIMGLKPKGVTVAETPVSFPDKIVVTNFDGTKAEIPLDVKFMETFYASKAGEKLKLENLNFVLNTFAITKESRSKLYELLLVMQKNPNLKISIQGHLCCLAVDRRNLSTQRAKAVKQFLELNGIESTRMTFKGFGSSMPLFSLPEKTEEERAANRRVEIEVLAN